MKQQNILAGKMNLPEKLIRDEQEQQQIVQQISQLQSIRR